MNHFEDIPDLKNVYFGMRHGTSVPNEQQLIVSDPEQGLRLENGLTARGRQEVRDAIAALARGSDKPALSPDTLIYSSDFSRAHQTAVIVCRAIGAQAVHKAQALRERDFGELNHTPHFNYPKVWRADSRDPNHTLYGVESVNSVWSRTFDLICRLENNYIDQTFVLVSHGDVLQIADASLRGLGASEHRHVRPIRPGEIRKLYPLV